MNNLLDNIIPAQSLQISVTSISSGRLELSAPLQPNGNDKGTAFAGSTFSILSLSGWGVISAQLKQAQISAEVMIVKAEINYLHPARAKLQAIAETDDLPQLLTDLDANNRGRIHLQPRLFSDGILCATLDAHYAVICKN